MGIYLGSGEGSLDFDNFTGLLIDAWGQDGKLDTARWGKLAFERMSVGREQEQEANMVVSHLSGEFNIQGPAFNILTACAASTQAIGEATMIYPARRCRRDDDRRRPQHDPPLRRNGVQPPQRPVNPKRRNPDRIASVRPFTRRICTWRRGGDTDPGGI